MGLLLGLTIYLLGISEEQPADQDAVWPFSDTEQKSDIQENSDMKREFCTILLINEDFFVLRNTAGEFYHVDRSFLGDFKEEDEVLLIYSDRTPIDEGTFQAAVHSILPHSSILMYPAN